MGAVGALLTVVSAIARRHGAPAANNAEAPRASTPRRPDWVLSWAHPFWAHPFWAHPFWAMSYPVMVTLLRRAGDKPRQPLNDGDARSEWKSRSRLLAP